jgi:hypothetical protein
MSDSLFDIDRTARALERAVLAYSLTGGERIAILLDRTVDSLAGVRRWLSEVPGANRAWVHAYLTMTALTARGRNVDPQRVPNEVDAFERWLATQPMDGSPWERPRTATIRFHVSTGQGLIKETRELVHHLLPSLEHGEEAFEDGTDGVPWSWSLILDADEVRADADEGGLSVTVTCHDGRSALDAELLRLYVALCDRWGSAVFAVAYDLDEPASVGYLLRGFAGGLPRWLFGGRELASLAGAMAVPDSDPPAYRVTPTAAIVRALDLADEWPHQG